MIGRCPEPILLTAYYLLVWVCSFIENNVPFDNTAPIYLINLLWKLWLGFRLESDSELHYFSIFHGE